MTTRQRQQKRQPRRQRLLRITVSLSLIMVMRGASDLSEDYVVHLKLFNDDRTKNIANFLKTRSYAFKDVRVSANTLNSWATLISSLSIGTATRGALKEDTIFRGLQDVIKKCNKVLESMLIRHERKYTLMGELLSCSPYKMSAVV